MKEDLVRDVCDEVCRRNKEEERRRKRNQLRLDQETPFYTLSLPSSIEKDPTGPVTQRIRHGDSIRRRKEGGPPLVETAKKVKIG